MKDIAKLVDVSIATVYSVLQRVDDKFKLDDEGGPQRGGVDERKQAEIEERCEEVGELFSQVDENGFRIHRSCGDIARSLGGIVSLRTINRDFRP